VGVEKPVGGNRSMKSNGCESCPAKASERAGGECCHSRGCEAYTARKQAVKVQLRNLTTLRCRRRLSSGRRHPRTTAIAKGGPESGESLAQGMFQEASATISSSKARSNMRKNCGVRTIMSGSACYSRRPTRCHSRGRSTRAFSPGRVRQRMPIHRKEIY